MSEEEGRTSCEKIKTKHEKFLVLLRGKEAGRQGQSIIVHSIEDLVDVKKCMWTMMTQFFIEMLFMKCTRKVEEKAALIEWKPSAILFRQNVSVELISKASHNSREQKQWLVRKWLTRVLDFLFRMSKQSRPQQLIFCFFFFFFGPLDCSTAAAVDEIRRMPRRRKAKKFTARNDSEVFSPSILRY